MSEQKRRVHQVPARTTPPKVGAAEQEPLSVAVTVPLDKLEEAGNDDLEVLESSPEQQVDEDVVFTDDETTVTSEDDDDDEDLSLLEGTAPVAKSKSGDELELEVEDEDEEGFLEIFREECLECKSLVPFAKKKFKECHFSKGNKHCPAEKTSIVIRVPLEEIVPRYIKAERSNDFKRLARFNMKLAEKPEWYQQRVAQAIAEARSK